MSSVASDDQTPTAFEALMRSLIWQDIIEYQRESGATVLLRSPDYGPVAGYFGEKPDYDAEEIAFRYPSAVNEPDPMADAAPMFRMAQDAFDGVPLTFEPTEWAELPDELREAFLSDEFGPGVPGGVANAGVSIEINGRKVC